MRAMDLSSAAVQRPTLSPSNGNGALQAELPAGKAKQHGDENAHSGDYFSVLQTASQQHTTNEVQTSPPPNEQKQNTGEQHPWHNLFSKSGPMTSTQMPMRTPLPQGPTDRAKTGLATGSNHDASKSRTIANKIRVGMHRVHSGGSASSSRSGSSMLNPEDLNKFRALEPSKLADALLGTHSMHVDGIPGKEGILVLDIRPSTSYAVARIRNSVNVCAPSTLLKRAGVTIERIEEEMLANREDQERFSGWRNGPMRAANTKDAGTERRAPDAVPAIDTVVVLDTDTRNITDAGKPAAGGGGSCLSGLLRKFDQAGFHGGLWWLSGGFEAFSKHVLSNSSEDGVLNLIDRSAKSNVDRFNESGSASGSADPSERRASVPNLAKIGELKLPSLAGMRTNSLVQPKGLPMEAFMSSSTARGKTSTASQAQSKTQQTEQDGGAAPSRSLNAANPFFDNIRQNRELQNGVTEQIPLSIPDMTENEAKKLPYFLRRIRRMASSERASTLAQSFYEVERAERDRLMDTMQRHADESDCKSMAKGQAASGLSSLNLSSQYSAVSPGQDGHMATKATFPFSIAAALERGGENRYNNIWTYEHSRVRCPKSADYLNGSYVEPARQFGCKRRYIATQAPLPSTFDTFWSVIWQQNVHTICMVTREFESGRVQSHNYWLPKRYGGLELSVVEEVTLDRQGNVRSRLNEAKVAEDNYFSLGGGAAGTEDDSSATIRRQLRLRDELGQERLVTQFQYVAWPDYSVPERPEDLLSLMRLASAAQLSAETELRSSGSSNATVGPLVVHCSAGVGRTGTYIAVDAALDVIRRMRWTRTGRSSRSTWDTGYAATPTGDKGRKPAFKLNDSPLHARASMQQQRRNLKRELSPSAMDLDPREGLSRSGTSPIRESDMDRSESGRVIGSPPPARRSRPDADVDARSHRSSSPTSLLGSSATSTPCSVGAISVDGGMQTPSTALGQLSLTPTTPGRTKIISAAPHHGALSSITQQLQTGTDAGEEGPPPSTSEDLGEIDLIRNVIDTVREQRMSMVQTTRQYVFAYWAVFCGVLDEIRQEESGE